MILGLDNEIAFLLTVSRYGLLRQVKMSVSLTQKHRLCAKTFSGDLVNFSLALSWGTPQSSGFSSFWGFSPTVCKPMKQKEHLLKNELSQWVEATATHV